MKTRYTKNRKCERCNKRIADDEPNDRGTEWDYNDLCIDCAYDMDNLGSPEESLEKNINQ